MNLERPAHVKARTEKPGIYPERFQVPEDKVAWDTDFSEYEPKYFVAPVVLDNSREEKEGGLGRARDIQSVESRTIEL